MRLTLNEIRLLIAITLIGWAADLIPLDDARAQPVVDDLKAALRKLEV